MAGLVPVFEDEALQHCVRVTAERTGSDGKMAPGGKANTENGAVRKNGLEDVPRPFFIGVAGGTASGKSTVCDRIVENLNLSKEQGQHQVVVISQEDFYRDLNEDEYKKATKGQHNFDHPSSFDEDLMHSVLSDLKEGKSVKIPKYDSVTYKRVEGEYKEVQSADVIVFEGILVFYFPKIRSFFNMKLFVDTDADTRLSRRVMTDVQSKGRNLDQVLYTYTSFVKPAFEEFCLPTKKYADVIIPRGADNTVAVDLIVQHIQELLRPNKAGGPRRIRHHSDSLVSRPH